MRILELILRIAHHHGRQWEELADVIRQWVERKKLGGPTSFIVTAIAVWAMHVRISMETPTTRVYSVPDLLLKSIATRDVVDMVRASWPIFETREHLAANDDSRARVLLAGKFFTKSRAYFIVDSAKQEVIMFGVQGSHYPLNGSHALTLPERFGHHHISGNFPNPGYTNELGGTFDTPKPFVLDQKFFACDHMTDIFDADNN